MEKRDLKALSIKGWQFLFTRIRSRRLVRDSGLLVLANIIVVILGLVRIPLVTRIFTKDEVGMIAVVGSLLPFMHLLSLSGLDSANYHYVARGFSSAFKITISKRLKLSILSGLGLLIGAVYWYWKGETTLTWLFIVTAVTYPFTYGLTSASGTLGAKEDFIRLFGFRVGTAISKYAGFVIIWLLQGMIISVVTFYSANILALLLLQVGFTIFLLSKLGSNPSQNFHLKDQQEMVQYGGHLTVIAGFTILQSRVDALLIGWLLPLSVKADFSIAQIVYTQVKGLWMIYRGIRYPRLVRFPVDRRRKRIAFEMVFVVVVFFLISLTLGMILWLFIPIILPKSYISSIVFICWLLLAFVAGIPGFFVELYFQTCQDQQGQYILRGTSAIVGVFLPLLSFFIWQVNGIMIGRFLANLLFSILGVVLFISNNPSRKILADGNGKL